MDIWSVDHDVAQLTKTLNKRKLRNGRGKVQNLLIHGIKVLHESMFVSSDNPNIIYKHVLNRMNIYGFPGSIRKFDGFDETQNPEKANNIFV